MIGKNGSLYSSCGRIGDRARLQVGFWDPTSANVSHQTFSDWVYFPNRTFYHQAAHGPFAYEEYADGGFMYSIADDNLDHGLWNIEANAGCRIVETYTLR